MKSILESSTLPIGGAAKRLKDVEVAQAAEMTVDGQRRLDDHHHHHDNNITSNSQLTDGLNTASYHGWPTTLAFQQSQQPVAYGMHYPPPYGQRVWCKQEVQDSDHHGFQDLHHQQQQLQLGNLNTHNFFQQNSVLHNLMGMESAASMEHGSGYNVIPMSTVIGNHDGFVGESDQVKAIGYDQNQVFASSTDPYNHAMARNVYYHLSQSQQSSPAVVKAGTAGSYDHQGSTCNNWVPTAVPTVKQYGCTLPWSSNVHSLE